MNVRESVKVGNKKMQQFELTLPEGVYEPIKQTVRDDSKRGIKAGKQIVVPEVVYARAVALKCVNPDFDFEYISTSSNFHV